MDCYKIARRIMDRIRKQICYDAVSAKAYHGVGYYDSSYSSEYFTLEYDGISLRVISGKVYEVEINHPRGIIYLDLRLWLLKLDRMTK